MKFVLPFFLVAILGTVGVYYGAQPLWLAMGLTVPQVRPIVTVVLPASPRDPYLRPATPAETTAITPLVTAPAAPATPRLPRLSRVQDPADGPAPAPRMTTSNKPEAPVADPAAEPAPAEPPPPVVAAKPTPPPTQGSKTWGMTLSRATYYSISGENRGQLAGGAVMDIEDSRSTSKGEMSMGRVERDGAMIGPYLVANSDLVRFNMPRSEVPADSIATLKQYYGLKGKLEQRIVELKKAAVGANPYAAAYADAVQKYNDFGRREKNLTARRDAAAGGDRMHYVDQLREMIPEGKRLENAVLEAKARYNKWKAANPGATPTADTSGDAQVQDIKKQLAELEPKVKEIVQ